MLTLVVVRMEPLWVMVVICVVFVVTVPVMVKMHVGQLVKGSVVTVLIVVVVVEHRFFEEQELAVHDDDDEDDEEELEEELLLDDEELDDEELEEELDEGQVVDDLVGQTVTSTVSISVLVQSRCPRPWWWRWGLRSSSP